VAEQSDDHVSDNDADATQQQAPEQDRLDFGATYATAHHEDARRSRYPTA